MPVAGLGSRFATVGITEPKPLIRIGNTPMVRWAADSIPFVDDDDFVFVVRQVHVDEHDIDDRLRDIFSSAVDVVVIDYLTEGPACTTRLAAECVDESESVVITDSDHYFENEAYCALVSGAPDDVAGAVPVFESAQEGLSYSALNGHRITRVREKERISSYANIGAYYYRKFGDFLSALERMEATAERVNNEYYVAPTYNELIADGKTVAARECETVWSLGTPHAVERFEREFLSDSP
jgi:NDP-sugar pyrophosphorylase family protein